MDNNFNTEFYKKELRRRISVLNDSLTDEYCKKASKEICEAVLSLDEYNMAKVVFCFVGIGREPDTIKIIRTAIEEGKMVCVPRCIANGVMEAVPIKDIEKDLIQGKYEIPEPREDLAPINSDKIDFAVIPCVTCDKAGNRLGHGKGYYDRYLKDANFDKVVICFSKVMLKPGDIPMDDFDIKIRKVISD